MIEPWEKRVAQILCNEIDKHSNRSAEFFGLPQVSARVLEQYQCYLRKNLTFPFVASYDMETGPFETTHHQVKVAGLEDDYDDFYGLLCHAREGRHKRIVALAELKVSRRDPNYVLVDDYLSWFWNCR